MSFFESIPEMFTETFITEDRWQLFAQGLGNTLLIAFFATLIGVLIGILVAVVRVYHQKTGKAKILNAICGAYLSVIRGTPVVVQLLILYAVIFASLDEQYAILIAVIGFGFNSGAYVAEIIRGGIMSIDVGQTEAGRSLGFNQFQTMRYIILPQALKNALPALGNEFIVLIKETSVAGYVAIQDLTKAAELVQSRTFEPFFPYISIAVIYWVIVTGLTALLKYLERRLAKSDRG